MAPTDDGEAGGRARAEVWADIRELRDGGWRWSETTANLLLSPHDGAAYAWYDPAACELRFSPKVVGMMLGLLGEDEGGEAP